MKFEIDTMTFWNKFNDLFHHIKQKEIDISEHPEILSNLGLQFHRISVLYPSTYRLCYKFKIIDEMKFMLTKIKYGI